MIILIKLEIIEEKGPMDDLKKNKSLPQAKKHNVYLSLEYMYKPCVLVKICLTCFFFPVF